MVDILVTFLNVPKSIWINEKLQNKLENQWRSSINLIVSVYKRGEIVGKIHNYKYLDVTSNPLSEPGGGGGVSYKSDGGDRRKFCKEPQKKVPEFCFVVFGRGPNNILPIRGTNSIPVL